MSDEERVLSFGEGRALLRAPTAADLGFVIENWSRSQHGSAAWRNCDWVTFRRGFTKVIEGVLQRPDTRALLACDEDCPTMIYGFIVWTPDPIAIHMVVVRGYLRGMGLGLLLAKQACPSFGETPVTVTATSADRNTAEGRKPIRFRDALKRYRLSYDPFRILGARA